MIIRVSRYVFNCPISIKFFVTNCQQFTVTSKKREVGAAVIVKDMQYHATGKIDFRQLFYLVYAIFVSWQFSDLFKQLLTTPRGLVGSVDSRFYVHSLT